MGYVDAHRRENRFDIDIIFFSETHMRDNSLMALLEPSLGVRWFGACRTPLQGKSNTTIAGSHKASGGVGFMVLNKKLSVHCIAHDNRGMMALSI